MYSSAAQREVCLSVATVSATAHNKTQYHQQAHSSSHWLCPTATHTHTGHSLSSVPSSLPSDMPTMDKKLNFPIQESSLFLYLPTLFQRHIMFPENGQGKFSCTLSCTFPVVLQDKCQKLYMKLYSVGFCWIFEFSFCDASNCITCTQSSLSCLLAFLPSLYSRFFNKFVFKTELMPPCLCSYVILQASSIQNISNYNFSVHFYR